MEKITRFLVSLKMSGGYCKHCMYEKLNGSGRKRGKVMDVFYRPVVRMAWKGRLFAVMFGVHVGYGAFVWQRKLYVNKEWYESCKEFDELKFGWLIRIKQTCEDWGLLPELHRSWMNRTDIAIVRMELKKMWRDIDHNSSVVSEHDNK